mmetsp:Transcript_66785/g.118210  ORF Transcript_66785/g.118210 Transcript_66785/m.118210 type:complete len:300 (+) Transcript_66785:40-939(+)
MDLLRTALIACLACLSCRTFVVPRSPIQEHGGLRGLRAASKVHESREAQLPGFSLAALSLCSAFLAGSGKHQRSAVARRATVMQWKKRVKRIQGGRALFDVTIQKPLGLVPKNFPKRPGVGVAKINDGGNTDLHNREVLLEDKDAMFVLEGDEVVGVNGKICEGRDVEEMGALVQASDGDSVTLTLCRNYVSGPVKILWKPSLMTATYNRKAILRICEENLGANVRYGCENGWCTSCWHAEESYMNVYRICKNTVPKDWDSALPLVLMSGAHTKRTTGLQVKQLPQADGVRPPREDGKL